MMKLIRLSTPSVLLLKPDSTDWEVYETDTGLGIIKSIDYTPKWGPLKHVSISRKDRYPSWEEILAVKKLLFGDIDVMMILPKEEDYVNIHPNCFHLWECPEKWELR